MEIKYQRHSLPLLPPTVSLPSLITALPSIRDALSRRLSHLSPRSGLPQCPSLYRYPRQQDRPAHGHSSTHCTKSRSQGSYSGWYVFSPILAGFPVQKLSIGADNSLLSKICPFLLVRIATFPPAPFNSPHVCDRSPGHVWHCQDCHRCRRRCSVRERKPPPDSQRSRGR